MLTRENIEKLKEGWYLKSNKRDYLIGRDDKGNLFKLYKKTKLPYLIGNDGNLNDEEEEFTQVFLLKKDEKKFIQLLLKYANIQNKMNVSGIRLETIIDKEYPEFNRRYIAFLEKRSYFKENICYLNSIGSLTSVDINFMKEIKDGDYLLKDFEIINQ